MEEKWVIIKFKKLESGHYSKPYFWNEHGMWTFIESYARTYKKEEKVQLNPYVVVGYGFHSTDSGYDEILWHKLGDPFPDPSFMAEDPDHICRAWRKAQEDLNVTITFNATAFKLSMFVFKLADAMKKAENNRKTFVVGEIWRKGYRIDFTTDEELAVLLNKFGEVDRNITGVKGVDWTLKVDRRYSLDDILEILRVMEE